MAIDTVPALNKDAFECPHCQAFAQQEWSTCVAHDSDGDEFDSGLSVATCLACNERSVWRRWMTMSQASFYPHETASLIFPFEAFGPPRHEEMPDAVAAIYDEASAVVNLSPRSASALLRLALEGLLTDLYPDAGNLNAMIGAAVADGLPVQVQQTMDIMRFSGNRSVHELHSADSAETAATLFGLLNFVVERLIAQPRQLSALYETIPESMRGQIEKRDGRDPGADGTR